MRRRPIVALGLIVLAAIGAWIGARALRPRAPAAPPPAQAAVRPAAPSTTRPLPSAAIPVALTVERMAADPRGAARAWFQRADAAAATKRQRAYGAAAASLAALPPDQAWPELVRLAKDGDVGAATLAAELSVECDRLRELRASRVLASRPVDPTAQRLPPPWNAFSAALDDEEAARRQARTDSCSAVNGTLDFAIMAIDRFMRPEDPGAQLVDAEELASDAEAIPLLRDLAARLDSDEARRDLGERLLRSSDAAQSAEGLRLLESLGDIDAAAAAVLANCYRSGCGNVGADQDRALQWLQTGAGLGDQAAAIQLNNLLADAHDSVAGWAWAMYELDLAASGCLETGQAHAFWLSQNVRRVADWEGTLDAPQRASALALLSDLRARWLARAVQALGCAG